MKTYTTHNLISIIALISKGLTAMSLPLRYSITLIKCLSSISSKFAVVIANAIGYSFNANYKLNGPMDVR